MSTDPKSVANWLLALAGMLAFAGAAACTAQGDSARHLEISLVEETNGDWRLGFTLAAPVRRLDLGPSLNGFRRRDWRVETGGIELVVENGRDVLVARRAGKRFAQASLRITPLTQDFAKHYAPIRTFAGGAVLYTGHFWPYTEEGVRYDATFSIAPAPGGGVAAFGAARAEFSRWKSPFGHPAFVYVGPLGAVERGGARAIIDPQTPAWARAEIAALMARLTTHYARAFGRALAAPPDIVLLIGDKADEGRLSYDGDALPGQILIRLAGGGWRETSPEGRALLEIATAHEAAHLWQSAARPSRAGAPEWIHEGGADALGLEALVALGDLPPAALSNRLDAARADCAAGLDRGSLAGAEARGAWRASYACGAVLAVVVARASGPGASVADFWREFMARAAATGGYDEALFLAMIEEKAGRDLAEAVRRFAHTSFAAPDKELARLLSLADAAGAQAAP